MIHRCHAHGFGLLALGLLASCTTERIDHFSDIELGMSRAEVRDLIGDPSSTYERESGPDGGLLRLERWQYGDNLSSLATGAVFSQFPTTNVWVVYFDESGRVVELGTPDWSHDAPAVPADMIPPRSQ
ncbi:MAG: outer membrane protein assembly factor BamE [Phycisphaerales bacterium]|nr:outer membrane protein assembly factor BamE [Phycisphaerales bacterium]